MTYPDVEPGFKVSLEELRLAFMVSRGCHHVFSIKLLEKIDPEPHAAFPSLTAVAQRIFLKRDLIAHHDVEV